jgi:SAM-dependent methyltransferase
MGRIARNRHAIELDLRHQQKARYFSPAVYCGYAITLPIALAHARGDLLDVGAGHVPFRRILEKHVNVYHTLDREKRVEDIDFVGDAQDMSRVISSDRYDTVLLLGVLEHVPDPSKVISEIYRILRSGGTLILSVPHLSRLHEEPYDFYRYTKYGLTHLLEVAAFRQIVVKPCGGLFCFVGHQISTLLIGSTWHIPIVKHVVFSLNKWLITKPAFWLDTITDRKKLFALGYVVVATK